MNVSPRNSDAGRAGIRLQLFLAKAGVASRRHAEKLIARGEVAVNGRVVRQMGTKVDPVRDEVLVRGQRVRPEEAAYFLLNKPRGYVTTASDPEGRETVFSLLKETAPRLFSVGRLDFNSEGALLLTNDGELAHALMHPSRGVDKVYHAKFRGRVTDEQLRRLREGVPLPPARADVEQAQRGGRSGHTPAPPAQPEKSAPAQVNVLRETSQHTWLEIVLREGKNRQIHRMAEAVGSSLLKLTRVRYGSLTIEGLDLGEARRLTQREIAALRRLVGLESARPEPAPEPGSTRRRPAKRRPARG